MTVSVRLGALMFALLGTACAYSEITGSLAGRAIPIVRLRAEPHSFAFNSGYEEPARLVIRDGASWQAAWAQTHANMSPVPPLPAVDFSTDMIVLVAMGWRPSGGYQILVEGASELGADGAVVAVSSTSPGVRCFVTAALTEPVDIVRMPRRDGEIRFTERSGVTNCP